jgi:nucleotide-binding universal stress UspA family protein
MKTILLLTDFSENAEHAAKSAVMLCSKLNANLMLYNNLIALPVTSYYSGPWVPYNSVAYEDERHTRLQKIADNLKPLIRHLDPAMYKPKVSFDYGTGNLGENVKELLLENDIELIVMGAGEDSTLDHILNGSDTSSVIDHANRPIIVVPPGADLSKLEKLTFATDFNESDIEAINYIAKLGSSFKYELDIVHVDPLDKKGYLQDEKEEAFKSRVNAIKYHSINYQAIKGKDIVKRLTRLCDESQSGLLAVVYYHHSFFIRMLHQSIAKKVLSYQKTPLMIVPSSMSFSNNQ